MSAQAYSKGIFLQTNPGTFESRRSIGFISNSILLTNLTIGNSFIPMTTPLLPLTIQSEILYVQIT